MRARARLGVVLPLLVLLSLVCGVAFAEIPTELRVSSLNQDHGLSDDTVEAILQDRRGFLWFGTENGLNRWDGREFRHYQHAPDDPDSLAHDFVMALVEDPSGDLWIGTLGGLSRLDAETERFTNYRHDPENLQSISNDSVYTLIQDRNGSLWLGTYWGLNHFHPEAGRFIRYTPDEYDPRRRLSVPHVRAVLEDRDGVLWVGTEGGGLFRRDSQTELLVQYSAEPENPRGLNHNTVWGLSQDRADRIWIATHGGLHLYIPESDDFTRFLHDPLNPETLADDHIDFALEDRNGVFWVGMDGGGLDIFDRETGKATHLTHDAAGNLVLSSEAVRTMWEDREGDLWIGTYNGGVDYYSKAKNAFHHVRHLPNVPESLSHSSVLSFGETSDDTLWVGTEGGLNRYDAQTRTFRTYRHDPLDPQSLGADAVLAIQEDSSRRLWVGTFFGGLNLFDPDAETFTRFLPDDDDPTSLGNPHVWDIQEDRDGRLWLATFQGVSRMDSLGEFRRFEPDPSDPHAIPTSAIWQIYLDSAGDLWLATARDLARYRPESEDFQVFMHDADDPTTLSHSHTMVLHEDRSGRFWVGTEGGGLNLMDREAGTFQRFGLTDGFPNIVYGISEDADGRLWLSGSNLTRFDPETLQLDQFDRGDGVLAGPFNKKSAFRSHDGRFYFGGANGYVDFDPTQVEVNSHIPPVYLTSFKVFGEEVFPSSNGPLKNPIERARKIILDHRQTVLTFEFASLDYRDPQRNQYSYFLEGFNKEWTAPRRRGDATYTNLDPGTYQFRVRGSNHHGKWNEDGRTIEVQILPPFWETFWFRSLTILFLLSLIFAIHQARTHQIRVHGKLLEQEIRERRQVEKERENLLVEMESKTFALELKKAELERYIYTFSHDLKSPLVTISGFLGALEEDVRTGNAERATDDVERIKVAAARMEQLLKELVAIGRVGRDENPPEKVSLTKPAKAAVRSLDLASATPVELNIMPDMPILEIDVSRVTEVYQNLIENAVQYMGDQAHPKIEIGAEQRHYDVLCWVRDNGIGIDSRYHQKVFGLFERLNPHSEGTGIGLALTKQIVETRGGRIWVESEGLGEGSTFFFALPRDRPTEY